MYNVFNGALRIHFEAKEVCLVNLLFPSFFLSPAQNTGISTLYRNSYGAPAEDIKHNQVSTETKMLLFRWQRTGLTSYMDMKNDIRKTDKSRLEELNANNSTGFKQAMFFMLMDNFSPSFKNAQQVMTAYA